MSNKYGGICYRCGEYINPGDGVFERTGHAHRKKWPGRWLPRWLTQHHSCAKKYRGSHVHYQFFPGKRMK